MNKCEYMSQIRALKFNRRSYELTAGSNDQFKLFEMTSTKLFLYANVKINDRSWNRDVHSNMAWTFFLAMSHDPQHNQMEHDMLLFPSEITHCSFGDHEIYVQQRPLLVNAFFKATEPSIEYICLQLHFHTVLTQICWSRKG